MEQQVADDDETSDEADKETCDDETMMKTLMTAQRNEESKPKPSVINSNTLC